ncbi:MAG: hypothetical protein ACLU9S_04380 [Oscillospiraceae bacterium]
MKETLAGHPVELVDLAGINEEELLFRDADVPAVVEKFRAADVDALFFPLQFRFGELRGPGGTGIPATGAAVGAAG